MTCLLRQFQSALAFPTDRSCFCLTQFCSILLFVKCSLTIVPVACSGRHPQGSFSFRNDPRGGAARGWQHRQPGRRGCSAHQAHQGMCCNLLQAIFAKKRNQSGCCRKSILTQQNSTVCYLLCLYMLFPAIRHPTVFLSFKTKTPA